MRFLLFVFFWGFTFTHTFSQDSLQVKELPKVKDTVKGHSWKKAILFSAVLPGAGQVYNHIAMPKGKKKAYWKVPLIYAGLGVTTFFAIKHNSNMKAYRSEYEWRVAGNNVTNFPEYDNSNLLTMYSQSRTMRDFSILGIGLVYLINIIDAGVEAHFVKFDVSDDLSLSIKPTAYNPSAYGVSLTLNFR